MHKDHLHRLLKSLEEISYLHRASTQIMSGWNVKIPEIHVKLGFAKHAFEDIEQSQKIDRHIWALTRTDHYQRQIPRSLRDLMMMIDTFDAPGEVVIGLYKHIKPRLVDLYNNLLTTLHSVLDTAIIRTLKAHVASLREQCSWGQEQIQNHYTDIDQGNIECRVTPAWNSRNIGLRISPSQGIWAPLDRPANAVRPSHLPRAIPGSLRILPCNGWSDPDGIGLAMHNQLHGEFTTMELMSRCLYEHPEMPPAFHVDMARHASDEARHATTFQELAGLYGVQYGDYPIYTLTYDGYYQFEPVCEAGSQKELLWRLILRGTIDEGLALDDLHFQTQSRNFLNQNVIATACQYILADETFHVQGALKWTRHLCDNDETKVIESREEARHFLEHRLFERRLAFEQEYPNAVEDELTYRRKVAKATRPQLPFTRSMNVRARQIAGYTDADLKQIVEWGYVNAE